MHGSLPSFSMFYFFSPRELQSTCCIYPRWKKPVLCYNRTTAQNPPKQLRLEDKNLAAGEGTKCPNWPQRFVPKWKLHIEKRGRLCPGEPGHSSKETASISWPRQLFWTRSSCAVKTSEVTHTSHQTDRHTQTKGITKLDLVPICAEHSFNLRPLSIPQLRVL